MKQSYQSVLATLQSICGNRPQVNSVDSGRELEFDVKKANLFPRVFIRTGTCVFNGRWEYNFDLLCLDRVNNDLDNIIEVMDLTNSILQDVISQLNFQQLINPIGVTLSPLYSYQDAQAAGWQVPLILFTTKGLECFDAVP